jgi:DNA-binding CsgD family transcriptional regulator
MIRQALTILLYMFAFATGGMTLSLSVVFHQRESYEWTKYFIIFHASLLLAMILQVLKLFATLFLGKTAALVTSIVLQALLAANVSFLILFIPYFTAWITALPWSKKQIFIYSFLAVAYMSLSILESIFRTIWAFHSSMMLIFIGTLFVSIFAVIINLETIENSDVRTVSKAIIILSFIMIPLLVVSVVYPSVSYISYPIYFMAFSIIILVYLFIYFKRMPQESRGSLDYQNTKEYNISEREFSVIELIREGLTNKEIAENLKISVNTVNNHVANIFSKVGVRSRIDLLNTLLKR